MRSRFFRLILLIGLISFSPALFSATIPSPEEKPIPIENLLKKISDLKVRDFQKLTGRKLTLKEKIGYGVLKHKIRKQKKEDTSNGQLSLILGIAGLAFFIAGLFLPALFIPSIVSSIVAIVLGSVAKKQNPNDNKAHAGKLLGWLTLGLLALLTIVAVIAIASWAW
ncbi:MAG TPA: hypothetical protein PKC72_11360 [Chitinophagaceae bacterium]|nr:hypothetical protein [Chitinophagaceae bacterium]